MRAKSGTTARRRKSVATLNLNNIRNFVCAASFLLAVWLGLTFVSDVPSHRYPSLGKGSVTLAPGKSETSETIAAAVETGKKGLATVPVSR